MARGLPALREPGLHQVCPVGATWKDEQTGIVRQDYDKCIGCRMCVAACPYTGVRSFNWEEPAYYGRLRPGRRRCRQTREAHREKCIFCTQRVARGRGSRLVWPGLHRRARHFGDLDDPNSEVSRLLASREYTQLHTEFGTKPSVYYLV